MQNDEITRLLGRLEAKADAHGETLCEVKRKVENIERRVGRLEVRSGFWGVLGGALSIVGFKLRQYLGIP